MGRVHRHPSELEVSSVAKLSDLSLQIPHCRYQVNRSFIKDNSLQGRWKKNCLYINHFLKFDIHFCHPQVFTRIRDLHYTRKRGGRKRGSTSPEECDGILTQLILSTRPLGSILSMCFYTTFTPADPKSAKSCLS